MTRHQPTTPWRKWVHFWFAPADPTTMGFLRAVTGVLVLYTHLAYSFDLYSFFGEKGWYGLDAINRERREFPWSTASFTDGWKGWEETARFPDEPHRRAVLLEYTRNLPTDPVNPGMSNPRPGTAKLRPEKTVSRSSVVSVRGEVVLNDQITPRAGAKVVFMNADKPEQKEYATANAFGEFDVRLPAGNWYMYVGGETGKATYHKQISLGDRDTVDYKVVSR